MNRAAYAVLAAGAIVTAAATYQLKQLNRDIRQARLLYRQMEDDHSLLVKRVIQVSDRLAPPRKVAPNVTPENVEALARSLRPDIDPLAVGIPWTEGILPTRTRQEREELGRAYERHLNEGKDEDE